MRRQAIKEIKKKKKERKDHPPAEAHFSYEIEQLKMFIKTEQKTMCVGGSFRGSCFMNLYFFLLCVGCAWREEKGKGGRRSSAWLNLLFFFFFSCPWSSEIQPWSFTCIPICMSSYLRFLTIYIKMFKPPIPFYSCVCCITISPILVFPSLMDPRGTGDLAVTNSSFVLCSHK